MLTKLSDLTPEVVDSIYNITGARPSESPTFLFMVGAPGSGKSSGHAHAIRAELLPPEGYATINMDMLLESLMPFRAASSMAQLLKRNPAVRFAPIAAYGTRKEDLGMFDWYDAAHAALKEADHRTIKKFDRIRRRFTPLSGQMAPARLIDINEAALARAIGLRIPIVYETTLSLTSAGRVNKVDALMRALRGTPYRVVFYHITGTVEEITQRIHARQEHETPMAPLPFYRYVTTRPEKVAQYIKGTAEAFAAVRKSYADVATFEEIANPLDPARAPAENRRSTSTRRRRVVSAYGLRSSASSTLGSSYRISSTSSSKRATRRRSTVRNE